MITYSNNKRRSHGIVITFLKKILACSVCVVREKLIPCFLCSNNAAANVRVMKHF